MHSCSQIKAWKNWRVRCNSSESCIRLCFCSFAKGMLPLFWFSNKLLDNINWMRRLLAIHHHYKERFTAKIYMKNLSSFFLPWLHNWISLFCMIKSGVWFNEFREISGSKSNWIIPQQINLINEYVAKYSLVNYVYCDC